MNTILSLIVPLYGVCVTFVLINERLAWTTHLDGRDHGDWITVKDPLDVHDGFDILADQCAHTLVQLRPGPLESEYRYALRNAIRNHYESLG